jgi:hypothetical protein
MGYNADEPRDRQGRWSSGYQDSLEHQLRGKGHSAEKARELAIEIMTNNGTLDPKTGLLTAKGREREAMGRAERRKDVHARRTGHDPKEIGYQRGRVFVK